MACVAAAGHRRRGGIIKLACAVIQQWLPAAKAFARRRGASSFRCVISACGVASAYRRYGSVYRRCGGGGGIGGIGAAASATNEHKAAAIGAAASRCRQRRIGRGGGAGGVTCGGARRRQSAAL